MGLFDDAVEEVQLKVTGMHCPKCVARVTAALEAVDGVVSAEVNLEAESAIVQGSADPQALVEAVRDIDFGAELA